MRPTPDEIIDGTKRVLADAISKDLESRYTKELIDHMVLTFSQFRWGDVIFGMLEENRDLGRLLEQSLRVPADVAQSVELTEEQTREVEEAVYSVRNEMDGSVSLVDLEFELVHARNLSCRKALETIIRSGNLWSGDATADKAQLRQKVWAHLNRYPGGGYWRAGVR